MKCITETEKKIILTLTEREAAVLKAMMQNPHITNEPSETKTLREAIFTALHSEES